MARSCAWFCPSDWSSLGHQALETQDDGHELRHVHRFDLGTQRTVRLVKALDERGHVGGLEHVARGRERQAPLAQRAL